MPYTGHTGCLFFAVLTIRGLWIKCVIREYFPRISVELVLFVRKKWHKKPKHYPKFGIPANNEGNKPEWQKNSTKVIDHSKLKHPFESTSVIPETIRGMQKKQNNVNISLETFGPNWWRSLRRIFILFFTILREVKRNVLHLTDILKHSKKESENYNKKRNKINFFCWFFFVIFRNATFPLMVSKTVFRSSQF